MSAAASDRPERSGERQAEERVRVRGAQVSAILLSVIFLIAGTIFQLTQSAQPLAFRVVRLFQMAVALGGLGYFLASFRRPRRPVAVAFCLTLILSVLVVQGFSAVSWTRLGRPWEAYAVIKLALVCVALVLPLSLSLSLAFVCAFVLEAVVIFMYQRGLGIGPKLPLFEPVGTLIFGGIGVILLLRRESRRRTVRDYLRFESETASLQRMEALFQSVAARLREALGGLTSQLSRVESQTHPFLGRVRTGVERLMGLQERLTELTGAPSAAEGSQTHVDASAPTRKAEHRFYARDAQNGATALAIAILFVCLAWLLGNPQFAAGSYRLVLIAGALLALFAMVELMRTRHDPRERRGLLFTLLLFGLALVLTTRGQARWAELGRPYEPHLATKFLMLLVPLVISRGFWIGFALEVACVAHTVIVWQMLHLDAFRDRIPLNEPWVTLFYAGIGVALMAFGERRRVASVRRLRAEAEMSMLARRALVLLALRDQLNSPLQVITIGIALLRAKHPEEPELHARLAEALSQLTAINALLPALDPKDLCERVGLSFDAARELEPPTARER